MKNNTQGFTLIELLIVIAIIGILAAVLIPNLLGARGKAVDVAAQAYARNVNTAATAQILDEPTKVFATGAKCTTVANVTAAPAGVTDCVITSTNDGTATVVVTYSVGSQIKTGTLDATGYKAVNKP